MINVFARKTAAIDLLNIGVFYVDPTVVVKKCIIFDHAQVILTNTDPIATSDYPIFICLASWVTVAQQTMIAAIVDTLNYQVYNALRSMFVLGEVTLYSSD